MKLLLAFVLALLPTLAFAGETIAVGNLLSVIVYLVIIGLVFWCIWWFVAYVGVPEPFGRVIRVIIGLVALLIVVNLLLSLVGSPFISLR